MWTKRRIPLDASTFGVFPRSCFVEPLIRPPGYGERLRPAISAVHLFGSLNFIKGQMRAKQRELVRCGWASKPINIPYHDQEWGVPVHDDRTWFEFLTLEGAQAGLSWDTVLQKR